MVEVVEVVEAVEAVEATEATEAAEAMEGSGAMKDRACIRVNQMFLSQASPPIAALPRPFHDQTGSAGFGTLFAQDFSSVRIRTIPTGGSVVLTPGIETSKVI